MATSFDQFLSHVVSLKGSADSILTDIHRVLSNIDHWQNTLTDTGQIVASLPPAERSIAKQLLDSDVFQGPLQDMVSARPALESYRNKRQGT